MREATSAEQVCDGRPVFGPEVKVPADASVQDKLIGVMGRRS